MILQPKHSGTGCSKLVPASSPVSSKETACVYDRAGFRARGRSVRRARCREAVGGRRPVRIRIVLAFFGTPFILFAKLRWISGRGIDFSRRAPQLRPGSTAATNGALRCCHERGRSPRTSRTPCASSRATRSWPWRRAARRRRASSARGISRGGVRRLRGHVPPRPARRRRATSRRGPTRTRALRRLIARRVPTLCESRSRRRRTTSRRSTPPPPQPHLPHGGHLDALPATAKARAAAGRRDRRRRRRAGRVRLRHRERLPPTACGVRGDGGHGRDIGVYLAEKASWPSTRATTSPTRRRRRAGARRRRRLTARQRPHGRPRPEAAGRRASLLWTGQCDTASRGPGHRRVAPLAATHTRRARRGRHAHVAHRVPDGGVTPPSPAAARTVELPRLHLAP